MLLPLIVFLVVVGLIVGAYLAITALPGMMANRELDKRLRDVSFTSADGAVIEDASVLRKMIEGPMPGVDRFMKASRSGSWLARLIEQSGVQTTPSAVMLVTLTGAVVVGLLTALFVTKPYAAPIAACIGAFLPFGYLMNRRTRRLNRFEEQFPEALDLLSRAVRAGHAFQTSMGMVADELADPVGPEFKKAFDRQNFGLPLRDALNEMAERIGNLDVRFFVTAVLIQRETGGNLAEILDNLAYVVRERFKIRRQVRVHTAHGRFTAWVLLSLPAALAVALTFINPDHMGLLFHEHMGQMMILGAIVMQTIGYFWIRKVIKIEV
jgi:tight adherence protein B